MERSGAGGEVLLDETKHWWGSTEFRDSILLLHSACFELTKLIQMYCLYIPHIDASLRNACEDVGEKDR